MKNMEEANREIKKLTSAVNELSDEGRILAACAFVLQILMEVELTHVSRFGILENIKFQLENERQKAFGGL